MRESRSQPFFRADNGDFAAGLVLSAWMGGGQECDEPMANAVVYLG